MSISINHASKVITIPKADTVYVSTNAATGYEIRTYDEYAFMRELADYLDSEVGAPLPSAFNHNTNVTIAGVVYARSLSFLDPYTITFENGTYQVKLVGGTNNNMLDVLNPNGVSVIAANSAGLQSVGGSGTAPTAAEVAAAVMQRPLEGALTFEQVVRIMLSPLAGKATGIGTGVENYLSQDGTKTRVAATFDASGNRTDILVDGT